MDDVARQARYRGGSIALHWLTLAALAAVYACIELREIYPKGSDPRETLKALHFMLGLSVLLLLVPRLLLRMTGTTPPIDPPPRARQRAASALHLALYALMLAMPLAGWALLSAAGKPILFFGLDLPPMLAPDKALAGTIKAWHETAGTAPATG